MPVSDIETADYNPRIPLTPSDPEWERLERIIDEYGMVEPLVWNERTGRLVGGHQRLAILKHKGVTEVDVSVVDLDEEREVALNIALNNPGAQSKWDPVKLVAAAESMTAEMIRLSGFDTADDAHEVMRRHELQRTGSFMSEFLDQPEAPPATSYENPADMEDGAPSAAPAEPSRPVETDMKEPHKHLAGEQYFEIKLVFDGEQRAIWQRFVNRLKDEQTEDNVYAALVQHASDYLAEGDADRIDEGVDPL